MAKKGKQQLSEQEKGGEWKVDNRSKIDLIVLNTSQEQTQNLLDSYSKIGSGEQGRISMSLFCGDMELELPANAKKYQLESVSSAIRTSRAESDARFMMVLDGNKLSKKFELQDLVKLNVENASLYQARYVGQEGLDTKNNTGFEVVDADVLSYAAEILPKNTELDDLVAFVVKKLSLKAERVELRKNSPFVAGIAVGLPQKVKHWLWWYLILPLKELKSSPLDRYSFLLEESFYRMKFMAFALILLVGMPIAAYNSGISGDEFVQYKQGKAVLDWFLNFGEVTDQNRTAVEDPKTLLHLYGSSFDVVTAAFNRIFNIENEYEWRHVLNSLTGWLLIVFCGLLAVKIRGWRAGLLAMFLVFVSPRILGHSWNNPKDIPFAMSYIIGLYYILNYLRNLHQIKFKHVLLVAMAIGVSIGIRIGGLLLFAYLFLFTGLYYLILSRGILKAFSSENLKHLKPIFTSLGGIVVLGYVAGIVLWPYALIDPIANPLESLNVMTSYGTSIRQLFEGHIVWSDYLPWYYISKYILITTPIVVWIGVILFFVFYFKYRDRLELFWKFTVFFAFAFPIAYIIYKSSNVYGGWRHALFVYPPVAVCAAIGYDQLVSMFKNKWIQRVAIIGVVVITFHPLKHTFSNHPFQYQYFNEVVGGIDAAASKYETDYYYHSTREAYLWLKDNVDWSKYSKENKLKVATNGLFSVRYFARHDLEEKVQLSYSRYYVRGASDWDYYICVNSYINPGQLKRGLWPPKNTAYAVKVDETPLCAVIERKTRKDLLGIKALEAGDNEKAIELLVEAIEEDPMSEIAYLNLAQAYLNIQQYGKGLKVTQDIMEIYPNYDKALYTRSVIYLNSGNLKEAIETSKEVLKENPKYDNAYYIMALAYATAGDVNSAKTNLKKCIDGMPNFKPAYEMMLQLYQREGDKEMTARWQGYVNQL